MTELWKQQANLETVMRLYTQGKRRCKGCGEKKMGVVNYIQETEMVQWFCVSCYWYKWLFVEDSVKGDE